MTLRTKLRVARLAILDAWDLLTFRRQPMTPSRVQVHAIGGGDFREVGEHLAQLLIAAAGLRPEERVLDVACGIGRVAVPLTRYLTTGSYTGFDVSAAAIRWCRAEISSRHPNFSFIYADVISRHYNPRGVIKPTTFTFPCANESIDVAFLSSILTHLTPDAAAHYVAETSRVLKPAGRAVMTFFLIDKEVREKKPAPGFNTYPEPWWAIQDPNDPEAAVAYDIKVVEQALRGRGLDITEISRGAWSGHTNARTYQDVVVSLKA